MILPFRRRRFNFPRCYRRMRQAPRGSGIRYNPASVIGWTATQLKLTSGIGALGTAALSGIAMGKGTGVTTWLMVAASGLPFMLFLIFHPDHFSRRIVMAGQAIASLLYICWVVFISVVLFLGGPNPATDSCGWPIMYVFVAVGMIPCVIVLRRVGRAWG